jgi:hypothetical protein
VRAAAEPVSRCEASLTRAAGKAPSRRLGVLRDGALDACGLYVEAFGLITSPERYEGDLEERVSFEFDQGFRAFTALAGRLPLGAQRELPEREGAGGASHVEPRFTRAAGEVAEKEVEVRCWAGADWRQLLRQMKLFGASLHGVDGFAIVGGGRVHLSPQVCAWIDGATQGRDAGEAAQSRWGYGLLALAHEAQHSQGVADEAEATCYALQTAPELTHALEIGPARIERLVEVFWTEFNALPPEYRSPECRAGGELDLHPGDGRWP